MSSAKNKIKRLKKYHKWPGLIIAFILIYYAISGILMNHRELISGVDVNRNILPANYHYKNWNLAALKGSENISQDSILIYGNIGIWLTDSSKQNFNDFNKGFDRGIDKRKVYDVHQSSSNNLYAATLFGLYAFDKNINQWQKFELQTDIDRFVAVISKGDSIIAMNRSYIFVGKDHGIHTTFKKIQLKAPSGYEKKVGLFETVWQIHSGEIFGLPGKLFVDFMGILVIILSVTGIVYFFFPKLIKRRKQKQKETKKLVNTIRWSLNWHNKIGGWFIPFLVILALTGMFLRPPLLLTIARANIPAIKYTHLDQTNPWYDDLRDIMYDYHKETYLLAGYNGIYQLKTLKSTPRLFPVQPPVSVMGINVFEKFDHNSYLVGSFSGLFLWNPTNGGVYDFISKAPYRNNSSGRPFGTYAISGLIKGNNKQLYAVDYTHGVFELGKHESFPRMPENIRKSSPMSLWNLSLEIHTGRIFHFLLSDFYILLVPLTGIVTLIVLISGYLIWKKRKNKKKRFSV